MTFYFLFSSADVDECTKEKHYCDQICHNTIGSYRCSCTAGYKLNVDGRTCEGMLLYHRSKHLFLL